MKRERVAVAAVMIVAVLLRVYEVFRFPFEQDELYSIDEATNLFHTRLLPGIQARPVFFLLEHPFLSLTTAPAAPFLRLLPLLFGVAGVWVTWRLARELAGAAAGFLALVLVAVSPWHLYASGFGRYYSLVYLLAALVYWQLPKALDADTPRRFLVVLIPLLLGTWTHPSFVFPVVGVALAVSIFGPDGSVRFRWPSRAAWMWLWGPYLALSILVVALIRALHHSADVANGGDRGLVATLRLVPAMVDWMTLLVATSFVAGVVLLIRSERGNERRFGWMAVFGCVCTLIALFALSFDTAIYADYGIAALPLVLAAAAFPVAWLRENLAIGSRPIGVNAVAWILVIGILPSTVSHLSDGTRFDYRPALSQINQTAPEIEVLAWPIVIQRAYDPGLKSREIPTTAAGLDSALQRYQDLWAIVSVKRYGIVGDDTGGMAQWLRQNCRQNGEYQRPRLDYRIYRVDLWRCTVGA
ncbi:MAG: glycosyltransferase family 39 protein [Gemmatimonadaceae bacterium]